MYSLQREKGKERSRLEAAGFTLVELIMVVVIIGLLAAIIVPRFAGQGDEAKLSSTRANLATLRSAVEVYRLQENIFPATLTALTAAGPVTGDIYLRIVPNESITDSNTEVAAFSGAGGWVYVVGTGEVRCNVSTVTCGAPCAGPPVIDPGTW